MLYRNAYVMLCLFAFLPACTGQPDAELPDHLAEFDHVTMIPADATPAKTVRLQEMWEIGPDGDMLIDHIYALATDEQRNIYISGGDKIHLFDPEGNYRKSIGQHGTGPGDLMSVFDLQVADNTLYALDFGQIRIQRFSTTSLEPDGMILLDIHTLPHQENVIPPFPLTFRVDDDQSFLIGFQHSNPAAPSLHFYRFDRDGNLVSDRLLSLLLIETLPQPGTDRFIPSPVGNRGLFQIGPDNRIYTASTKDFFIKIHAPDGSYQSALYHPIEKRE
ncbi:MAG: 6-bladed beta-propeller, partial [Balneolaceae bacterium]